MSKIQVDTIDTRSGTATMQIGSTNTSTITLGVSGDTINVPSGVTIANAGTATGFGESNTPSFRARLSGDQSVANQTTTKLSLATEDWDTDSAWNTSNYNFTIPSGQAGKYFFNGHVRILSIAGHDTTNYFSQVYIRKNTSDIAGHRVMDYSATSKDLDLQISTVVDLSVSDVIDFTVYHNGSGQTTQNISSSTASTWFTGFKITT